MKTRVVSVFLLSLILAGCGGTSTVSTTSEDSIPLGVSTTSGIVQDESKVFLLSSDFNFYLQNYLSEFSYIELTQSMESYSLIGGLNNKVDVQSIIDSTMKVDLKNKISLIDMTINGNKYCFADDIKRGIYISKLNNEEFIYSGVSEPCSSIDFSSTSDAYDFVHFICDGGLLKNSEFVFEDKDSGTFSYTIVRDAVTSDIDGVKFTSLGKTITKYELRRLSDGNVVPKSVNIDVTFFVGQKKFGVSTHYEFLTYSNKDLELPEYIDLTTSSGDATTSGNANKGGR